MSLIAKVSLKHHFEGEITELFTGNGRFPAHFYLFVIGYDDLCSCWAVGDAKHYLVSCPLTGDLRAQLRFHLFDLGTLVRDASLPVLGKIACRVRAMLPYIQRH
ncbi:hypothetical protein AVEN_131538-1 [Araneus ventricosus]|uniref:Uncharacterized protein n=1 Tax=Araneus ventricosus TaxID=182803 RepID=A0A4Y2M206_ARAVE|nr:hypothetical protein AVEN_131538-1 [Araneus ventricosus]